MKVMVWISPFMLTHAQIWFTLVTEQFESNKFRRDNTGTLTHDWQSML